MDTAFKIKTHAVGAGFLSLDSELSVETIDAAAGINQFLFARKERVALGANFHSDFLFGGTGFKALAASASDSGDCIIGMDALFHFLHLSLWIEISFLIIFQKPMLIIAYSIDVCKGLESIFRTLFLIVLEFPASVLL